MVKLSNDAVPRVARATRIVERQQKNTRNRRARWQRRKQDPHFVILNEDLTFRGVVSARRLGDFPLREIGDTIPEVHDRLLNDDQQLDAETVAVIQFISGKWYVTATGCIP